VPRHRLNQGESNHEETVQKENASLKAYVNKLAGLFEEYVGSYKDQVSMLGVLLKNTQTVEKYLQGKIEEFNQGDNKK
jgi:hypothetical protein